MVYTRTATRVWVIDNPCLYQGHQHLLGKPGLQRLLAGARHVDSSVYSRSPVIPLLIPGEVSYSHQWPWCGERFLGLNTPEERFLGRLQDWRLGERDPRCWEGPGQRVSTTGTASKMPNTVGGRSARLKAAASGWAASINSHVSGRAARGSG